MSAQQINLTGVWYCDDNGTYYIQQNGDNVWWYGEKSPNSSDNPLLMDCENPVESWSNVARGEISGNLLVVYQPWHVSGADLAVVQEALEVQNQEALEVQNRDLVVTLDKTNS